MTNAKDAKQDRKKKDGVGLAFITLSFGLAGASLATGAVAEITGNSGIAGGAYLLSASIVVLGAALALGWPITTRADFLGVFGTVGVVIVTGLAGLFGSLAGWQWGLIVLGIGLVQCLVTRPFILRSKEAESSASVSEVADSSFTEEIAQELEAQFAILEGRLEKMSEEAIVSSRNLETFRAQADASRRALDAYGERWWFKIGTRIDCALYPTLRRRCSNPWHHDLHAVAASVL